MEEGTARRLGEEAIIFLRSRICNPISFITPFMDSPNSDYNKLKFIISNSITEACNHSILLLGPRECGKIPVLDLVLRDLNAEYADTISVVRLNGHLHSDDINAFKEIARQLCLENQLLFSRTASFDDNSQFMFDILRECGLAHKTIVFVLNEFDLFAQGKQRLLYSLLDAMQSLFSQAVVIGVSCRLDADQLLEKRVRSRFSHRKILFVPPSIEDLKRLLGFILYLPTDSTFPHDYAAEFNGKLEKIFSDKKFKEIFRSVLDAETSIGHLSKFLFQVVCSMDTKDGFLSLENFETARLRILRGPKLDSLRGASILELYLLVCMNKLEAKERDSYNFNTVMKEYKSIHDSYQNSDYYSRNVCLRAFEHLLEREIICFTGGKGQSVEYRPVKLLISSYELHEGLKANCSCPGILHKLFDHES